MNNYSTGSKFSIIFLPVYLMRPLQELKITSSGIKDNIVEYETKMAMEGSVNLEDTNYEMMKKDMYKFLGLTDIRNLVSFNETLNGYLGLDQCENLFTFLFADIQQENNESYEKNSLTCLNTLMLNNINDVGFKDTYEVVNSHGVISVIMKEGFVNYIMGANKVETKLTLLKDIIESINDKNIVNSSVVVSYLKLANLKI